MIDIHSHIIPGIDDGPATLVQSKNLLRAAIAQGTTFMMSTSHITPGVYPNSPQKIKAHFNKLLSELGDLKDQIQLGCSAEVRVGPEMIPQVERDEIPWLGELEGNKVILLELPHTHVPIEAKNIIRWLVTRGIRPLIAHPERNAEIMRVHRRSHELADLGCLFQVTAASLYGGSGPHSNRAAEKLAKDDLIYVIASDAHNTEYRPPGLEAGLRAAERLVGSSKAADMVFEHPWLITKSHFSHVESPDVVV